LNKWAIFGAKIESAPLAQKEYVDTGSTHGPERNIATKTI
jgi:hypothetical protein